MPCQMQAKHAYLTARATFAYAQAAHKSVFWPTFARIIVVYA
jgi:hypothetical protein